MDFVRAIYDLVCQHMNLHINLFWRPCEVNRSKDKSFPSISHCHGSTFSVALSPAIDQHTFGQVSI